jgi:hypothetical protein
MGATPWRHPHDATTVPTTTTAAAGAKNDKRRITAAPITTTPGREHEMGQVLQFQRKQQVQDRFLYRSMDNIEEATAALYAAAEDLARAGRKDMAKDFIDICEIVINLRRELPQGLDPQAA